MPAATQRSEGDDAASGPRRVSRCPCREGPPADPSQAPAVRFRVPLGEVTRFDDAVFGPREVASDEIEDFVLLRSPKPGQPRRASLPTYQLGAVVDDIDMRITHVIRGADHISNTPKQVLLYRALGAAPPIFAHVPLILGPDRTRLSKRHGATSVGSYREEGFLPEAFRNFLALLGWSPGDDSEFLRTPKNCSARFSLAGVSRTNAVFDRAKLEWFNTAISAEVADRRIAARGRSGISAVRSLWREEWAGAQRDWFSHTVDLLRPRTRLLPDFSTWARAFFSDEFAYDSAAREKFWKDERLPDLLGRLAEGLAALPEWNHDACDQGPARYRRRCGREGRPAHQCHARSHRRPSRRAAAVRDDGRPRPAARRRTPPPRPSRSGRRREARRMKD